MKFATIILLAAMMTGCVSTYETDAYEAPGQKLLTNASAYVTMAKDGRYGSKNYLNSGYFLSSATTAAVSLHLIPPAAIIDLCAPNLSFRWT